MGEKAMSWSDFRNVSDLYYKYGHKMVSKL